MLINVLFIILLTKISEVSSLNNTNKCNPIYNCPPGSEIISCFETGTSDDVCKLCKEGTVQPDYISSHTPDKNCFKRTSSCLSEDITYSRERKETFCNSLGECRCNLALCFFGDPCLCDLRREGCPENEFLEENGECTPCPKGAAKNGTGCGQCMYQPVDVKQRVTVSVHELEDTGVVDSVEKEGLVDNTTESTSWIPNVTSKPMVVDNCVSINIVITLAVIIGVLGVIIIILIYKRKPHQQFKEKDDETCRMALHSIEADKMM